MTIYSLTNEELAEALEVIARNDCLKTLGVVGFEDDKKKEYPARQFLQEAASRLARMKNEKSEEKDENTQEEPATEDPKPDKEPAPTDREVLKKSVVMLAEAVKARSRSVAFDTCNRVLDMMRKLERN